MSKVLVTGAEGFIGSHLVEELLADGHRVRALVMYNSFNSWGWLETLPPQQLSRVEVITGDVRDSVSVKNAMVGVDVVYHLAALIAIPYSYQAPESYIDTNIKGTLHVLQAARELKTKRVLVTSTSEVYGTARFVPITESHPKQGQSPYSASKIGADALAESYYRSFDLPVTIVRPFNTYGPRQSARAVIPSIIVQLLTGVEQISLGALHPTRDLVYVKDTARGFIALAQCDAALGAEVNIATKTEISIEGLALKLISAIAPAASIKMDEARLRPTKSEVERLLGDNTRMKELANWQPRWTLEEGLSETINWFRVPGNLARYKSHIYNV